MRDWISKRHCSHCCYRLLSCFISSLIFQRATRTLKEKFINRNCCKLQPIRANIHEGKKLNSLSRLYFKKKEKEIELSEAWKQHLEKLTLMDSNLHDSFFKDIELSSFNFWCNLPSVFFLPISPHKIERQVKFCRTISTSKKGGEQKALLKRNRKKTRLAFCNALGSPWSDGNNWMWRLKRRKRCKKNVLNKIHKTHCVGEN